MDLLLVRCADLLSEDNVAVLSDREGAKTTRDAMNVALSPRGERHTRRLATWLNTHAPRGLQVFSGPAKGGRQMAEMIAEEMGTTALSPVVSRLLAPTSHASDILGAIGWPDDHKAALVVAHQPAVGALASLLLTGHEAPLAFKRGAIWWFSNRHRDGEMQTVLRCALTPDLLKGQMRPQTPHLNLDLPKVVDLMRTRMSAAIL